MFVYWADFAAASLAEGLLAALIAFAWGRCGILILGPACFFGMGAYAVAIVVHSGATWTEGAGVGVLAATLVAGVFAWLTLRREGGVIRFAAATFVGSLVAEKLAIRAYSLTRGSNGLLVQTHPTFFLGLSTLWSGELSGLLAALFICVLCVLILCRAEGSLGGRALMYVRDAPDELVRFGVDIGRVRLGIAIVIAGGAALAGALYAPSVGIVSPDVFDVANSMQCLAWVVIGGMRPFGAFVAACAMRIIEVQLGAAFADWYLLGVAAILVAAVFHYSKGRRFSISDRQLM